MNILYIGSCDSFCCEIVNKFVKEDNSVNILSPCDFLPQLKPTLNYKIFNFDAKSLKIEKVFSSIHPDIVIFSGNLFGSEIWNHDKLSNDYYLSLINALNFSISYDTKKFIYLSSHEVYGENASNLSETNPLEPISYKGILCKQGEQLVENICKNNKIDFVCLRFANVFGYKILENKGDLISLIYNETKKLEEIKLDKSQIIYPVSQKDATEAIYRACASTPNQHYNVAGPDGVLLHDLYLLLNKFSKSNCNISCGNIILDNKVTCSLIKKELEWFSYHDIREYLSNYIIEEEAPKREKKNGLFHRIFNVDKAIFKTLENLIMFTFFAILALIFKDHSVLKNIDFMSIVIILSSLIFGVKYSILTVICAFIFYLFNMRLISDNLFSVLLNADTFLILAQYIFMGVAVGYAIEQANVRVEQANVEKKYLKQEFDELRDINHDNILIKRQYEKRLLEYKTSLPKLYSITSQLDSLNPEIIFPSIINIFNDVLETDTVSVYSFASKTDYARLVASLNNESIFKGKSFKLSDYPDIKDKLENNDIYIGNQLSDNTPSLVGAVFHKGEIIAIFIINEMAFENLNLYQVNLFRTLISLITASFVKAYQYEEKIHDDKYILDTEILNPADFHDLLELKHKNMEDGLSEHILIKILHKPQSAIDFYKDNYSLFRNTDYFGIDENNNLYVLLSATNTSDLPYIDSRLSQKSIAYELVVHNTPEEE